MSHNEAIPCMVLSFTEKEIAIVKGVLEASGYEDDLKAWILDTMTDEEEQPGKYAGSADRVIHNMADFVKSNPDTIKAAGDFVGSLFMKKTKKGQD